MYNTPFHYEINPYKIGIRTNIRPISTVILCFRSPYGSPCTDRWLEHKMLKLYTTYYNKVMKETGGKFWEEENEPLNKDLSTIIYGGEAVDGHQIKESKTR